MTASTASTTATALPLSYRKQQSSWPRLGALNHPPPNGSVATKGITGNVLSPVPTGKRRLPYQTQMPGCRPPRKLPPKPSTTVHCCCQPTGRTVHPQEQTRSSAVEYTDKKTHGTDALWNQWLNAPTQQIVEILTPVNTTSKKDRRNGPTTRNSRSAIQRKLTTQTIETKPARLREPKQFRWLPKKGPLNIQNTNCPFMHKDNATMHNTNKRYFRPMKTWNNTPAILRRQQLPSIPYKIRRYEDYFLQRATF
mmetsp:Transcript_20896/g.45496  ORF Transcript_20896/g.45496 Transcript_20896/m.45496 type:complete len:252 (-) Transcript_20896:49-804(-)